MAHWNVQITLKKGLKIAYEDKLILQSTNKSASQDSYLSTQTVKTILPLLVPSLSKRYILSS